MLSRIEEEPKESRFIFPLDAFGSRHSPMYDASRLQMIVTLARQRLSDGYLDVHPNASEESALEALCSYSPGIAGMRLSEGVRIGEALLDRYDALKPAAEKMANTDSERYDKVISGRTIDLMCVSGSKVQYLKPLFASKSVIKEPESMRRAMKKLVRVINKESHEKVPDSLISSLGLFSTELMQNTQEHAVFDHTGRPLPTHVEGMILGWKRLTEKMYLADFSGHAGLRRYWQNESEKTDSGSTSMRMFEVSYFDSGPGLVGRYTGTAVGDMSIEEEQAALIGSLRHKATSKPESAAGEGFSLVLNELRRIGGLIRIRSGRLSMFNSFDRNDKKKDIFDFNEWVESGLSPVQGAVISILVPLRGKV